MIKAPLELEKELQRWREARARRQGERPISNARRTVRVNGQEIIVIKKAKRALAET